MENLSPTHQHHAQSKKTCNFLIFGPDSTLVPSIRTLRDKFVRAFAIIILVLKVTYSYVRYFEILA